MSLFFSTLTTDRNLLIITGVIALVLVVCLVFYFRSKETYAYKTIPWILSFSSAEPRPRSSEFTTQPSPSPEDIHQVNCIMRRLFHNEDCYTS